MSSTYPDHIWHNGAIMPWASATVHVMAHALHYGSSVFEGIRSYPTPDGQAIFRLTDHLRRLYQSAKIYDMVIPYPIEELAGACRAVITANGFSRAYLRPLAFRGLGGFGLSAETPIDVTVASWEMGAYLGRTCWRPASTPACRVGSDLRRTRSRPAPRPVATIFPDN